jgi:hypothetical protein
MRLEAKKRENLGSHGEDFFDQLRASSYQYAGRSRQMKRKAREPSGMSFISDGHPDEAMACYCSLGVMWLFI